MSAWSNTEKRILGMMVILLVVLVFALVSICSIVGIIGISEGAEKYKGNPVYQSVYIDEVYGYVGLDMNDGGPQCVKRYFSIHWAYHLNIHNENSVIIARDNTKAFVWCGRGRGTLRRETISRNEIYLFCLQDTV